MLSRTPNSLRKVPFKRKPRNSLSPKKRPVQRRTGVSKKKPRKATAISLWREWLVPDHAYRRFKGLRGIYWYWLSRDIRKSEWEKWDGLCLTCLLPIEDWHYADCGHVIASHGCGEFLRFNRINLTIQHKACNNPKISPNASALNAVHYDQRYGVGAWDKLYAMRKRECKEPTKGEYVQLIRALPSYQEALAATQT